MTEGLAIKDLTLRGIYVNSLTKIGAAGNAEFLEPEDINALKNKSGLTKEDQNDIINTLLYLSAKQPLSGENEKIYAALLSLVASMKSTKPAVYDYIFKSLSEQDATNEDDDGVNEKKSAGFTLAELSKLTSTITNTKLPTSAINGPVEIALVNDKYFADITEKILSDSQKQELSKIIGLSAETTSEKSEKMRALVTYFRNTLGWTQAFIAIALSSNYLLKDGIDKLNADVFESFVRNEIIAFRLINAKDEEKSAPLYTYDSYKIVDASSDEMIKLKQYLQSSEAVTLAADSGITWNYDPLKSIGENFEKYINDIGITYVYNTDKEFLLYDMTGQTNANKAKVTILNTERFLATVHGKTEVTASNPKDKAIKAEA